MRKFYALLLLSAFLHLSAFSQTLLRQFPQANNDVWAIAKSGNTVYIGGDFTFIGPDAPYGAIINGTTGEAANSLAKPDAAIGVVEPDGAGGWYIGGQFTQVNGQPRNHIARITSSGALHPWNPDITGFGPRSIQVVGNTVYVGGSFTHVGGVPRSNLAAIDATTGMVTPWNPGVAGSVASMVVSNNKLYIGGDLSTVAGQQRRGLAAFDLATGNLDPWNPNPGSTAPTTIFAMAMKDNTLYVGGSFFQIGGQLRSNLAAIDATTGATTSFNPAVGGNFISALAINGNTLYMGGGLTSINGQPRQNLGAMDLTNNTVLPWNPGPNDQVNDIIVDHGAIYIGGGFTSVAGQERNRLAAFNATTGNLLPWNPNANNAVFALGASWGRVFAGGAFTSINGGAPRNRIAAFDATTGRLTPWNPGINNTVKAITVANGMVYAGGNFSTVGGATRINLAAIDSGTGTVGTWAPNPNGAVHTLLATKDQLYIGGEFQNIGAQLRRSAASFDINTGNLTPWNPSASGSIGNGPITEINTLAAANGLIYAGGNFSHIGGQAREGLAALDPVTGAPTSLHLPFSNAIMSIGISGNTLYAGGFFQSVAGQVRSRLAAVDLATGVLNAWNPNAGTIFPLVFAISVQGNTVYAGGSFENVGGQPRLNLAALHGTTGAALPWKADAVGSIYTLLADGPRVYVGGGVINILGEQRRGFAVLESPALAPLPVELVSFNARARRSGSQWQVATEWTTASEENTAHFIVERSSNGRTYVEAGRLAAAGNASSANNYNFTDPAPLEGISQYRLKIVDQDGSFTYSPVRTVVINSRELQVLLYPNPVKGAGTVMIASPLKTTVGYNLIDISGRTIKAGTWSIQPGSNQFTLPTAGLSAGLYTLQIINERMTQQVQVVKQ